MNNPSMCPDIILLSRVLDHEASPPEEHATAQHLATCVKCSTLMARLQSATERANRFVELPLIVINRSEHVEHFRRFAVLQNQLIQNGFCVRVLTFLKVLASGRYQFIR